jgi:catechol 2,3-dioxygenase-like lactoylglutathione lyase family enzyme
MAAAGTIRALHHVGIPVTDMARAGRFYRDMLGFAPCPAKPNWLAVGPGYEVHLMPTRVPPGPVNAARHFAFEVGDLAALAAHLLAAGLAPYQLNVDQSARRDIRTPDDPLDFGLGTVFVEDPDGNTLEFLQPGRGILREVLGAGAEVFAQ